MIGGVLAQLHEDLLADVRAVDLPARAPAGDAQPGDRDVGAGGARRVLGAVRLAARHLLSTEGMAGIIGDV